MQKFSSTMLTLKRIVRLVSVTLLIICSSQAFAAVNVARSITYFDANNHIVGQQYISCQNLTRHAGVIDVTNPYRSEQQYGCGKPELQYCDTSNGITFCSYSPDYASSITYFLSATGYTAADFCNGNYNHATEFVGRRDCRFPAPQETPSLSPWLNGWGS